MQDILEAHFANQTRDPVRYAFSSRRAVLPWRNKQPLASGALPEPQSLLHQSRAARGGTLAYLHIPFCANHCLFCGFYRHAYSHEAAARYTDLLIDEIALDSGLAGAQGIPVEAVYVGGGTPSALSADEIVRVLAAVRRHLPLSDDCEVTLEGRITHFDADKIDACLEAGINRISIGVQSFDTTVRRRQGRKSSREEVIGFLQALRERPDLTVVIDLLYGLPGQTDGIWHDDVRTAIALAPDGIDLYGLNLIPGTPLRKAVDAGKFPGLAQTSALGAMYRIGVETLGAAGWRQVSNSHWRRTLNERNRYNLRIKQGADCLAYGAGAGGLASPYSYAVSSDLKTYAEAIQKAQKPVSGVFIADDAHEARHLTTAGFEVGVLNLGVIAGLVAPTTYSALRALCRQWQSAGLLSMSGDLITLTVAGRFWYSNLVFAFDAMLTRDREYAAGDGGGAVISARTTHAVQQRHADDTRFSRLHTNQDEVTHEKHA